MTRRPTHTVLVMGGERLRVSLWHWWCGRREVSILNVVADHCSY